MYGLLKDIRLHAERTQETPKDARVVKRIQNTDQQRPQKDRLQFFYFKLKSGRTWDDIETTFSAHGKRLARGGQNAWIELHEPVEGPLKKLLNAIRGKPPAPRWVVVSTDSFERLGGTILQRR